jgi:hypothetical protein
MINIYENEINNDTIKLAFLMTERYFIFFNYHESISALFLKETYITRPEGVQMKANHILFQIAEDVMQHTIATGIPQWRRKFNDNILNKFEPAVDDDEPKVFALKDLSFGFNIILIALGISIFAFVLEVVYFQLKIKIRRCVRKFLGNVLVLRNVLQWLKRYHV